MYRFVTGKYPFEGATRPKLKANIIRGIPDYDNPLWESEYKDALVLVKNMLQYRTCTDKFNFSSEVDSLNVLAVLVV